jgi:acetoin utilization deacetylase AcuC-like enzyme
LGTTGLITHGDCLLHDTGAGHPERPERLRAVLGRLDAAGVGAELEWCEAPPVDREVLHRVHPARYVERLAAACEKGPAHVDGDTAVCPASFRAALLAAGGVVCAARSVWEGAWHNAFVAVRPPGHHAESGEALGFCLFNSVAVAARALQALGARRVAILDWDVHHGNGTQHLFEADPTVFYASLHQWPLYPGTGTACERGVGPGEGATLNVPMPPGTGDREWIGALEAVVLPALDAFAPEAILISAGFDAHRLDPLAACTLSAEGFASLTQLVVDFARGSARGRVVSVLEGGYHLEALAESARRHVEVLREAAR